MVIFYVLCVAFSQKKDGRGSEGGGGKMSSRDGAAVVGSNVSLRCSVFGLPSAVVSWWSFEQDQLVQPRLIARGTDLTHSWEDQYYSVNEYRTNAHQVRKFTKCSHIFHFRRVFSYKGEPACL